MPLAQGLQILPQLFKDDHIGAAVHADRIGKVFSVLDQEMRQCLICDGVFTRHTAVGHAGTACLPQSSSSVDGETIDANW
jgi:hypothetical protein